MRLLPEDVKQRLIALMMQWRFDYSSQRNYLKRLRFYLDFCHKYSHSLQASESRLQCQAD
jgi:hypothetical protein